MPNLQFRLFRDIRERLWDPRLIRMTLASVIAGTSIGVVGGSFRWCLVEADQLRDRLIVWSHGFRYVGWIIPVIAVLLSVAVARLLVQKVAPEASGSGIQRVEAIMAGEIQPDTELVLPVKFFGGLLSLGSGMALGREGPTVKWAPASDTSLRPFWCVTRMTKRLY